MTPADANAWLLKVAGDVNTFTQAHDKAVASIAESQALTSGATPVRLPTIPPPAPIPAPAPVVPKSTVAANLMTTVFMTVATVVFLVFAAGKITLPTITWPTIPIVTPVTPSPTPVPKPVTPVAPTPAKPVAGAWSGELQGVLVLPVSPTQAESAMKADNADIASAFKSAGAIYAAVSVDHSAVSSTAWKALIQKYGPPPVLIFRDPSDSKNDLGGTRVSTPADVVAAVKKLRGTP